MPTPSVTIGGNTYSSGTLSYNSNSSNSGSISINSTLASNTITINVNNGGARICIDDISWTSNSTPSYTIVAQSNNNSYGTVSLSGNVITGSPNSGYQYASPAYTVTSGTATVSQSGNDFTVTPSSNCTIQINFEAIPASEYTVTYDANGGTGTMTDSNSPYSGGSTVTTLTNTFTREGYTFNGWNTQSDGGGTSYDEEDTFTINANTTL